MSLACREPCRHVSDPKMEKEMDQYSHHRGSFLERTSYVASTATLLGEVHLVVPPLGKEKPNCLKGSVYPKIGENDEDGETNRKRAI